jgi:short subunit dehydrogenase-like uncharacterized protein
MSEKSKKYDIVLMGATGFTGKLVAKYLSQHADAEAFSWAIAGRSESKLRDLQKCLDASIPEIIVADVKNAASVAEMCCQAHVLMNAAGPFNLYGRIVVDACIQNGTHYTDITGEPSFVSEIYNDYHSKADAEGVCIVNCCGFDSIPADYGVYLTAQKLPASSPKVIKGYMRTNAQFSGGTLTTAVHALYLESLGKSVKTNIPKFPNAPKVKKQIHYNPQLKGWGIPMPVVDPHIVKRSAFRLSDVYGPLTYVQYFVRSSFGKVVSTVAPIVFAMLMIRFSFFRNWLFAKFPSGSGPDEKTRSSSRFEVIFYGQAGKQRAKTVISGGDPGYTETAKMFSQCAFVLLSKKRIHTIKAGVLTPVEAFGMALVERLQKEGISFKTDDSY